jgi:hypothetical protein
MKLENKKIAILATHGFEQSELDGFSAAQLVTLPLEGFLGWLTSNRTIEIKVHE